MAGLASWKARRLNLWGIDPTYNVLGMSVGVILGGSLQGLARTISLWNESVGINKERPNGMKKLEVGSVVVYVDPVGVDRNALVTAVWGELDEAKGSYPSLNLVYVSTDPAANDQYGRQLGRTSSCVGRQAQAAPGNYWKFVGE